MPSTPLNHHASKLLPHHTDEDGTLHLLLERKDAAFKPPYFDSGLCLLGGNSTPDDEDPKAIMEREILEEFWAIPEDQGESYSGLFGQAVGNETKQTGNAPSEELRQRAASLGKVLLQDTVHIGTFLVNAHPPLLTTPLSWAVSVYAKALDRDTFLAIKDLIEEAKGTVTTHNHAHSSTLAIVTVSDINAQGQKFAWGHEHLLNTLLAQGVLGNRKERVTRTFPLIDTAPLPIDCGKDGPSFAHVEAEGYAYDRKNITANKNGQG